MHGAASPTKRRKTMVKKSALEIGTFHKTDHDLTGKFETLAHRE
jgi:hypothetical protein